VQRPIELNAEPTPSIRRQCKLLSVSRQAFYYQPLGESAKNLELMRRLDLLHLADPCFGYRKLTAVLQREGWSVNSKRVRRLMKLLGIEAIYQKPRTSQPKAGHKIYPYLLRDKEIQAPDEAWCADITYIPMPCGFMYLVAVMDWYSRYVLSWRLSNTMDTSFCTEALEEALSRGRKPAIFNPDQGSQFSSSAFTGMVQDAGVAMSMDGRGRWLDNVFIERLWRSYKYESVYLHSYQTPMALEEGTDYWFSRYNTWRPHQHLDYATPQTIYKGLAS